MSHTPGPWSITNDINEEKVADVVAENGGVYIRLQHGAMPRLKKGEKARLLAELAANANLVAAAPDMAAALVEITSLTEQDSTTGWNRALKMCAAALEKAGVA